jgi:DNA helicase II / ATP-dependent DNA helicase PcrA
VNESFTLDEQQGGAAFIEPGARQIVLAPPGTGKTEVVAALIDYLVEEHDLSAADEILAISFSRAAVSALRNRTSNREAAPVSAVRTLDSLASRLLDELDDEDWQHRNFDDRVRRARDLLRGGNESEELSLVRHLIVDEVQDLVGVRAELVLGILAVLDDEAGFTVLGDPRQAVYNFQLEAEGGLTSDAFLDRIRGLGDVKENVLGHQYRARSKEARGAAALSLGGEGGDEWVKKVRSFSSRLFMAGDVRSLSRPVQRWTGRTAFLCRTNGQALVVAAALREGGLAVTTRAPSEELPVAPWIGSALSTLRSRQVRRGEALPLLERVAPVPPEAAWRLLKSAERDFRSPDRLDLQKLATRISTGDLPADLLEAPSRVVVSTIHRAKGLEFDNVVLVNAADLLPGGSTEDDAAVAYVALTRARDQVMAATCELPRYIRTDQPTGRWIIGSHQAWQTRGFEVRGIDTRTGVPVDTDLLGNGLPPGTPVTTALDPRRSTLDVPVYSVRHEGRVIARTSERFGELLARRIRPARNRRVPWPTLTELALESIETVATASPVVGEVSIGLGARVSGMAMLDWGSAGGVERD